ncbi:MAG: hypothetical protein ACSHX7_10730 [Luteolibacter sp.]
MLYVGLAVVGLILAGAGGLYALKEYRDAKPGPIWAQMPLNPELPDEKREELAIQIKEGLLREGVLDEVVAEAGLTEKFGLGSDEETVKEMEKRVFVKVGTVAMPAGKVPSLNIGVEGKRGERATLEAAAMGLMKKVWVMMGLDPETGRPLK